MASPIFGDNHHGTWVRFSLIGGHDITAEIVAVGMCKVEVRERGAEETWHIHDRAIAKYQIIAEPTSNTGQAA
jgi:hypothetical protein